MLLPAEVELEVTFRKRRATVRRYRLSLVYERDTSMGLFYSNFTLYGPDQQKVVDAVRRLRRTAYVSPTVNCFTTVYDREAEHQDFDVIEQVGRELSLDLQCPVMGVVLHDDDVLYYWLFRSGDVHHTYNSSPAYFDPDSEPLPPEGGDADELCVSFGVPSAADRIEAILRQNLLEDGASLTGELERHWALAAVFGMPDHAIGVGYDAIQNGYLPERIRSIAFEQVGK